MFRGVVHTSGNIGGFFRALVVRNPTSVSGCLFMSMTYTRRHFDRTASNGNADLCEELSERTNYVLPL